MLNKLICVEGNDGSGKSTQTTLIKKYLESKDLKVTIIHFPAYNDNIFSAVISAFLRGEYGDSNSVNPYFPAAIYAMDQFMFLPKLKKLIKENDVTIIDRYVYSNIAYQGAKFPNDSEESKKIKKWIESLEFDFLKLPKPDLNLFFYVDMNTIKKRLENRNDPDREYLKGMKDIHERDIDLQSRVSYNYVDYFMNNSNCEIVEYNLIGDNFEKIESTPENIFKSYKKEIDKLF